MPLDVGIRAASWGPPGNVESQLTPCLGRKKSPFRIRPWKQMAKDRKASMKLPGPFRLIALSDILPAVRGAK